MFLKRFGKWWDDVSWMRAYSGAAWIAISGYPFARIILADEVIYLGGSNGWKDCPEYFQKFLGIRIAAVSVEVYRRRVIVVRCDGPWKISYILWRIFYRLQFCTKEMQYRIFAWLYLHHCLSVSNVSSGVAPSWRDIRLPIMQRKI